MDAFANLGGTEHSHGSFHVRWAAYLRIGRAGVTCDLFLSLS